MSLFLDGCHWTHPHEMGLVDNADNSQVFSDLLADRGNGGCSGVLKLPEGVFTLSREYSLPANIRILGAGKGRTVLKFNPAPLFTGVGADTTRSLFRMVSTTNIEVADLSIEQISYPPRSYSAGVVTRKDVTLAFFGYGSTNITLRNVAVDCKSSASLYTSPVVYPSMHYGLYGPAGGGDLQFCQKILIDNCEFMNSSGITPSEGSYGLSINGCFYYNVKNSVFSGNFFDGLKLNDSFIQDPNPAIPINVFPVPTNNRTKGGMIEGCQFLDNGQVVPLQVRTNSAGSGYSITMSDPQPSNSLPWGSAGLQGNGNGIDVGASNVTVRGCFASGNFGTQFQAKVQVQNVLFDGCIAQDSGIFPFPTSSESHGFGLANAGSDPILGAGGSCVSTFMPSFNVAFVNCFSFRCGSGIHVDSPFCRISNCFLHQNRGAGVTFTTRAFGSSVVNSVVTGNNVGTLFSSVDGTKILTANKAEVYCNAPNVSITNNQILGIDFSRTGNCSDEYISGNATSGIGIQGLPSKFILISENIIDYTANSFTSGGTSGYITNTSSPAVLLNNYNTAGVLKTA